MYRPLVSQTLGENVKKNFFPVINISALGEKNFREKFINKTSIIGGRNNLPPWLLYAG
jgi:hypothetical protein